LLAIVFHLFKA